MNSSSKKIAAAEVAVVRLQPFELAEVAVLAGYEELSVSDYIRSRLGYRPMADELPEITSSSRLRLVES